MQRLSVARLREVLSYNKSTGLFRWRLRLSNRITVGAVAGSLSHGYVSIRIDDVGYRAHRLAHLYVTGKWPRREVDHEDMSKNNNRWGNIRKATHRQNGYNTRCQRNNKSGFKGVYRRSNCIARWSSTIKVRNKRIHLGMFGSPEAAHAVYVKAAKKYFGKFARG